MPATTWPDMWTGLQGDARRLAVLALHDIPELADNRRLSAISDFAAKLCDAPIALVGFIETSRHWFAARTGVDADEAPRETAFCAHAMHHAGVMVVPDATADPRFAANPLVAGPPHLRFYAGAPLVSDEGAPLGALCVFDLAPRTGLTPLQREGLETLAQAVMAELRAARVQKDRNTVATTVKQELAQQEARFHILADTMPQMVWSTLPDGYHDYYNARWYEFTGMPPGSTDGEAWNDMFHPDDRERAWTVWRHSLATGDPYEIEYRLRDAGGEYRWVLGRALPMRGPDGAIDRWFGTCTDIHETKLALEQREIISHELSHRIKNIFSVIGGLISISARAFPESRAVADELRDRVMALGRAHDFVRPHSEASRKTAIQPSLHGMLDELVAPYQSDDGARIVVTGDDPDIDDRSATPLALLFHELATNAAKYGALSVADGTVAIAIACAENTVDLRWSEHGGPPVTEPAGSGFGTRLIELSAVRQLGGTVVREWKSEGLVVKIAVPLTAMRRKLSRKD